MRRPDYVPVAAWHWLTGAVVDLAKFPGAQAAAVGLLGPEMARTWRAWADQIDADLGWHRLCEFLALLPSTYRPENIAQAKRLRAEWDDFVTDLDGLALRAADINRRALELGFENPIRAAAVASLDRLADASRGADLRPERAEFDYLEAEHASAQAFVQHFDARWAGWRVCGELSRVTMTHTDVARIGAATGLAYCEVDAVRNARVRKPTAKDPHDPARGVFVLRNTRNTDPDN